MLYNNLPLFYTSFIKIRRKMSVDKWRKLHKLSYLAYALIYVHLVFAAPTGHLMIHTVIFGVYTILRLLKYFRTRKTTKV